jgi:Peptidase A4 family
MLMPTEKPEIRVPYELVPTNLAGAFITPAPPADFDPNTASPAALIKHGFLWRRPGKGDDPVLRAAWERAFSRRWRAEDRLVPELEPQVGKTHNLRGVKRAADGTYTGTNWAGSVVQGKWTGAIGFWAIPVVTEPLEPQGTEGGWNSASWVGIDGSSGSDDVLQAGVRQSVDALGNAQYVAWFEWFAPPQSDSPPYVFTTDIPNFVVVPGQTVYCSVQYVSNGTAGQVSFANETTDKHFSITLAPRPAPRSAATPRSGSWNRRTEPSRPRRCPCSRRWYSPAQSVVVQMARSIILQTATYSISWASGRRLPRSRSARTQSPSTMSGRRLRCPK